MKRITAFLMASLLAFMVTTQPARAFLPVAVIGLPQIVTAGSGSYAIGVLSGLVGIVGLYLTIEDAQENAVRIPLGPNSNNLPPAPTAPAVASMEGGLTVPADKQCGRTYTGSTSYGFVELCTLCMTNWGQYPGKICLRIDDSSIYYDANNTQGTCPSGYTNTGGTCTLQNARQVTDDKTCDILLSSGQFATADDMNCPSTVDGSKLAPMIRNGKTIAYGKNSNGDPLMWEVTPGATKYTVKQFVQTSTATQTQVQTTTVTVDAATSEITSVQTQTSPGAIETPGSQSVPTQAEPTTENTPTVTQDTTKTADKITCGLPGTPPCAIDDTGFANRYMPPSTSTYNPDLNKQKDIIENIEPPNIGYGWLPSLLPGDAVACHAIQFHGAVNVGEVNLDSTTDLDLCPYLEIARNILGWLFGVASVIYIWRRFAGARGGSV